MDELAGYDCINDFIKEIESNCEDNKPILIDNKMTSNYLTIKQLTDILNYYLDDKIKESHLLIISNLTKLGIANCIKPISIESDEDRYAYDNQYVYVLDELACNEYKENTNIDEINFRKEFRISLLIFGGIGCIVPNLCIFLSIFKITDAKINLIIILSFIPLWFILEVILLLRLKKKYKNKIDFSE